MGKVRDGSDRNPWDAFRQNGDPENVKLKRKQIKIPERLVAVSKVMLKLFVGTFILFVVRMTGSIVWSLFTWREPKNELLVWATGATVGLALWAAYIIGDALLKFEKKEED